MKTSEKNLSIKKIFWIFLIASVIGAFYEELLLVLKNLIRLGTIVWEPRRGVFWGPISPIYGMGAVLMCLVLVNEKDNLVKTFFKAAILGGLTEYVISFLQEFFLGTSSWNYTEKFLNINGRTTIPFMIFWGILGIFFVKIIYPLLSNIIDLIPSKLEQKVTIILVVLLSIDCFISWSALIRQTLRNNNVKPFCVIGEFYDKHFNDDYILKKFPNMLRDN